MSRVLLFVQSGDARPTCRGEWCRQPSTYANLHTGAPSGTKKQRTAKRAADRWWLVECMDADAGRAIIAENCGSDPVAVRMGPHVVTGRILASGGRP
jgi:hypothetical protein